VHAFRAAKSGAMHLGIVKKCAEFQAVPSISVLPAAVLLIWVELPVRNKWFRTLKHRALREMRLASKLL
jgi:hypothetical protein